MQWMHVALAAATVALTAAAIAVAAALQGRIFRCFLR